MVKRKATAVAQIKLRLRETLRADLEASAKKNDVSLNQEIVNRLIRSFTSQRDLDLAARVDATSEKLDLMKTMLALAYPDLAKKVEKLK